MISNIPPRGTSDWFPDEFSKRKYIFDVWRSVCLSFGFEEYLTPILENADIYRRKSGGDLANVELVTIKKEDEELAIRPEMTPSVTRMVSRVYKNIVKPIKLFSIANFYRFQRPQKGRNREFWQLNCDIFGVDNHISDFEIIQLAIEIMRSFGANENQFILLLNYRKFLNYFFQFHLNIDSNLLQKAFMILDKFTKVSWNEFTFMLQKELNIKLDGIKLLQSILLEKTHSNENTLIYYIDEYSEKTKDFRLQDILNLLKSTDYTKYVKLFLPLVRGLDYYDGMVFEVFDKDFLNSESKKNSITRSLFGGGRYNGLSDLYIDVKIPSVGFAPGDETTKLFLEKYNLLPDFNKNLDVYYLPILSYEHLPKLYKLAELLRKEGKQVFVGIQEQKLGKALDFANKKKYRYVVFLAERDLNINSYLIKDMNTGKQEEFIYSLS